jgi:CheY-like chemotaxis protein
LRAAEHGARLTAQLLAFGRRQPLQPEPIRPQDTVKSMQFLIARALGETIRVEIVAEEGLWACHVDKGQFQSAILNLTLNARDAMPTGGILRIDLRNAMFDTASAAPLEIAPGAYVQIVVTDTGIGMSSDIAAKAFEPFFTTKEPGKGTGLGLSQVYGFTKQSRGTTVLRSESGKGTAVTILLPRAEGEIRGTRAPVGLLERPTQRGNNFTILIVEDEPEVTSVVRSSLEHIEYKMLVARDAHEALKHLGSDERIDLLFSDIVLPGGINGIELARLARRLRTGIRVLLTSGYPGDHWPEVTVNDNFQILQKPYRPTELVAKVDEVLHLTHDLGS